MFNSVHTSLLFSLLSPPPALTLHIIVWLIDNIYQESGRSESLAWVFGFLTSYGREFLSLILYHSSFSSVLITILLSTSLFLHLALTFFSTLPSLIRATLYSLTYTRSYTLCRSSFRPLYSLPLAHIDSPAYISYPLKRANRPRSVSSYSP